MVPTVGTSTPRRSAMRSPWRIAPPGDDRASHRSSRRRPARPVRDERRRRRGRRPPPGGPPVGTRRVGGEWAAADVLVQRSSVHVPAIRRQQQTLAPAAGRRQQHGRIADGGIAIGDGEDGSDLAQFERAPAQAPGFVPARQEPVARLERGALAVQSLVAACVQRRAVVEELVVVAAFGIADGRGGRQQRLQGLTMGELHVAVADLHLVFDELRRGCAPGRGGASRCPTGPRGRPGTPAPGSPSRRSREGRNGPPTPRQWRTRHRRRPCHQGRVPCLPDWRRRRSVRWWA